MLVERTESSIGEDDAFRSGTGGPNVGIAAPYSRWTDEQDGVSARNIHPFQWMPSLVANGIHPFLNSVGALSGQLGNDGEEEP